MFSFMRRQSSKVWLRDTGEYHKKAFDVDSNMSNNHNMADEGQKRN